MEKNAQTKLSFFRNTNRFFFCNFGNVAIFKKKTALFSKFTDGSNNGKNSGHKENLVRECDFFRCHLR